ncbi:S1 family peptidase [Pseudonocardiaceae bacterium YIM PH 21723]|nr:S1 family peptidase [Pseudonocardiaceae bacterium YIM PH 21723]
MYSRFTVLAAAAAALVVGGAVALGTSAVDPIGADPVAYSGPLDPAMLQAYQRDLGLNESQARYAIGAEAKATQVEQRLQRELGAGLASSYYNAGSHKLVAHVNDEATATQARAAGAEAKVVPVTGRQLRADLAKLDAAQAPKSVTGWYLDATTNKITVTVLKGASADAFLATAGVAKDSVAVRESDAAPQTTADLVGGIAYNINGSSRCSIGFPVTSGSGGGFVSAGHCGTAGSSVTIGGQAAGSFTASRFPGNDWSLITTNATFKPTNRVQGHSSAITGSTEIAVGASICRAGSTNAYTCGVLQGKSETVNYPQGSVAGLHRMSACADPGDSGGSVVAGANAQGMTSGISGGCASGNPQTWFQPVNPALSALGAKLVTGAGTEPNPEPNPQPCAAATPWNVGTAYQPGDLISHNGHVYKATYWSTGVQPDSPVAWSSWADQGAC